MNDLVRAASLFGGQRAPSAGLSGVLGTVANPPPEVAQLPVGTTLQGVVTGHDGEGHLLVRTELGTLAVATKATLPVDSEVTLQIRSTGTQLHVLLMHSEAPPAGAQGAAPPSAQPASTPRATGGGAQGQPEAAPGAAPGAGTGHGALSDLLTLGQTVRAVVQAPAGALGATSETASGATAGTTAETAAGAASRALSSAAAGTAGGPGPSATPGAAGLQAVAAQLAPGSELRLSIIAVQAPAQTSAQTPVARTAAPGAAGQPAAPSVPGAAAQAGTGAAPPGAQPPGIPSAPGAAGQAAVASTQDPTGGAAALPAGQAAVPAVALAGAPAAATARTGTPAAGAPAQAGTAPSPTPSSVPSGAPFSAPAGTTAAPSAPAPSAPAPSAPGAATPAPALIASYAAAGAGQVAAPGAVPATAPSGSTPSGSAAAAATGTVQGAAQGTAQGTTAQNAAQPAAPAGTPPAGGVAGSGASAAEGALRFTGRVTTVTHAGQPVLSTPLGTLTLEIQAPLPIGSRLTLALPVEALPQPADASRAPAALGTLAHTWPALEETLQALREIGAPGTSASAASAMVPRPGPKLTSGLLFFLAALGGDVGRWLGNQATQALKNAGRDSLLTRLGQDFGQLSRLAESPGGDWRLFFIPLLDGDQVQQLRLFLRHGQQGSGGGGDEEDDEPTRFVVELELSHLGDLQLDGLVRDKRFDLILRTRAPLPEFMRRDIAQIFQDANGATGYAGNIAFQSSAAWRFMPIETPADVASPGVVV